MLRIKKLDIFVLKSFCMLFMGTFFICLFIFMMQFLWRYVDEMRMSEAQNNYISAHYNYRITNLTLLKLTGQLETLSPSIH